MKKHLVVLAAAFLPDLLHAQHGGAAASTKTKLELPQLQNKAIPGSPVLAQPFLVEGTKSAVKAQGLGWSDPVLYDWNGDGKKDLLIGEFSSMLSMQDKSDDPKVIGSHIRVYLNSGTKAAPVFTGEFEYAKDKTGAYLNVITGCCIGFTPRFYDLNNDGYTDIITGSFLGQVTCYYGSKDGFESPIDLEQQGFPGIGSMTAGRDVNEITSSLYWSYSSADFVDVDGDGLLDLITGGAALRVSKNVGTKTNPVFAKREMLLTTKGEILAICEESEKGYPVGVYSAVPLVTDWDQDGVPDLLVTSDYATKQQPAISFFRGVRQNNVLRFEDPVSLFDAEDGQKLFPGAWLRTWVADWNDDGINDLIIGTSIPTIDDQMDPFLSWVWEKDLNISKASYRYMPPVFAASIKKSVTKLADELSVSGKIAETEKTVFIDKVMGMAHEGFVYVLLGKETFKK